MASSRARPSAPFDMQGTSNGRLRYGWICRSLNSGSSITSVPPATARTLRRSETSRASGRARAGRVVLPLGSPIQAGQQSAQASLLNA